MDDVIVVIGGQRFVGWKEVTLNRTMEAAVNSFEVRAADIEADRRMLAISAGAPVEIYIGNDRALTGYIQEVLPDYDDSHHDLLFLGDSKTVDLVDCSTEGRQFKNQTLLQIARALAEPFGITVTANVPVGEPFKSLELDAGQPIYEFLEYAARMRGLRFVPTDDGNLVIDTVGQTITGATLALGKNILSARPRYSMRERYSQYTVVSDDPNEVSLNAEDTAHKKGVAKDPHVRYRPIWILSDFPADIAGCNAQALWQSKLKLARSQTVTYQVKGWRDDEGQLWTPNTQVMVRDRYARINERMLIVDVKFSVSNKGRITDLVVMHPEAMKQQTIPEPAEEEGGF